MNQDRTKMGRVKGFADEAEIYITGCYMLQDMLGPPFDNTKIDLEIIPGKTGDEIGKQAVVYRTEGGDAQGDLLFG